MATSSFDPLSFLMKISPDLLTQYAKHKGIEFQTTIEEASEELADAFMQALEKESEDKRDSFWLDVWEIDEMGTDMASDNLVNRAIEQGFDVNEARFQKLNNSKERAMYFYLNFYQLFTAAFDDYSIDNMQGWRAEKTVSKNFEEIILNIADLEQGLKAIYAKEYKGKNLKIKHFEKKGRVAFIAFIEDFLINDIIFKQGALNNKTPRKPVFMIYFLYRPADGVLEVKAKGGRKRIQELKESFIEHLLKETPNVQDAIRYDFERVKNLESLEFPIEANDSIESVVLKGLRLFHNSTKTRLSIDIGNTVGIGKAPMLESLKRMNIDLLDYTVTQFKIEIIFKQPRKGRIPRVTTTIGYPNTCDLKERDIDLKVRELLKRWSLDMF